MTHHFRGTVQSGTGRGAKFIAIPIYSEIFESHLGDTPFYGTLNLQLDEDGAKIINQAFQEGQVYEDLVYEGKEFGGIVIVPVRIKSNGTSIDSVAVRPYLTTHDSDVVELVATKHLRKVLDLEDGDTVSFELID